MKQLTFYLDFISPYAYLASTQLAALCSRNNTQLTYQPVLFAGLLRHWGQLGPAEIPPKREFLWKDSHRIAARWGVPFQPPKAHPFNPLLSLRLALPLVAREEQEKVIQTLWRAGWIDGRDLSSADEVRAALEGAQLDADALIERSKMPEAKEALRQSTDDAARAGVFGVPSFLVEGEAFWGSDRLDDLANFLQGKDPIDAEEIRDFLLNYKASAERLKK